MFKEIDASAEAAILAGADQPRRKKRGEDFSIRTVTQWFKLMHRMSFCTVPSHYDNVPDFNHNGEEYDKYPSRMCVTIDGYQVCRWCFLAEADQVALKDGHSPIPRSEVNAEH